MEIVEGQTLAGPLPLNEALPLIRQLIDGIEAAHDKGIVHRDRHASAKSKAHTETLNEMSD